jgi:hypothetical protein
MGDRYFIKVKCVCGEIDDDVLYAPTCGALTWKCPNCKTIMDLEEYTGIDAEGCASTEYGVQEIRRLKKENEKKMKKINLILLIMCLTIFSINIINAEETRNIEYAINVSYMPYCPSISCTTVNITSNITNMTIQNTSCNSVCYGKIKLEGINSNQFFVEIDTGSAEWLAGKSDNRYGYKTAYLGNLSDISGIREELRNLSMVYIYLNNCNCSVDKATIETNNMNLQSTMNTKDEELKDRKNERYYFGIGGILIGVMIIKLLIPFFQGTRIPKDPLSSEFPSNVPHRYG